MTHAGPFLKWVGGKGEILDKLPFPKKIDNYYEPFLGGGSVLIHLLNKLEDGEIELIGKITANDINTQLIGTFRAIKEMPNELSQRIQYLADCYKTAPLIKKPPEQKHKKTIVPDTIENAIQNGKEVLYYFYRNWYNSIVYGDKSPESQVDMAALFIVINRTCFRGVHRVGKDFNVPFGNYLNPWFPTADDILILSNLFNKYDVDFRNEHFTDVYRKGRNPLDFYYLDPPYYPIDEKSFTGYNEGGFNMEEHNKLIIYYRTIANRYKSRILMSNADVSFITDALGDFNIEKIPVMRRIHSKNPGEKAMEVLIKNY